MSAARPQSEAEGSGDPAYGPAINSHHTTVTYNEFLAVTQDPAQCVEHLHPSLTKRTEGFLTGVATAGALVGGLGLLCTALIAVASFVDTTLDPGGGIPSLIMVGVSVGLIATSIGIGCLADRLGGVFTRRAKQFAILTVPLGNPDPDPRRSAAIRSAFAERVTVEVRDQLQEMVAEGHANEAQKTLSRMLESAEKQWVSEGEASGKVLAALMAPK